MDPWAQPPPGAQQPYGPPPDLRNAPKTDELAVVSLVLAIVGVPFFCCCGWISLITSIAAIACGAVSLQRIKTDPKLGGRGLAIAGIILGASIALVFVLWLVLGLGTYGAALIAAMLQGAHPPPPR